jgi:hypothetical protein
VFATLLQPSLFRLAQWGAPEQFTLFNTELSVEIACFVPSASPLLLLNWFATRELNADAFTVILSTATLKYAEVFALYESKMFAMHVTNWLLLDKPAGSNELPYVCCDFDCTSRYGDELDT